MNSVQVAAIVFACAFGASLVGTVFRAALPGHHLSSDSKDAIKSAMGLIATMAALLLGLLVASAKSSYDNQRGEIERMSAQIIYLDRILATYGPGSNDARAALRVAVSHVIDAMWPREKSAVAQLDPMAVKTNNLYALLQQLDPQNDMERSLKSSALQEAADLGLLRWNLYGQRGSSVSGPLLTVVVFWLAIIFMSFGLFSPKNWTVQFAMFLCALSVAGAILLVLELDHPFDGFLQISSAPMRMTLEHLGR